MWRRSRRFTNQQYPNLELQQNKPQTNNTQSWNSNKTNHKPTTPKAATPTKKPQTNNTQSWNSKKQTSRAGGEATTTEQYMMKTTRSYRIGTSQIKHGCNRYKNNYYKQKKKKKKKKKKSCVQAGCAEARVVWEKEGVGLATYSLHHFSICHCSISYLLLTGPHHPNLLPRNHSDRHARSGKQTGICADLSPKTLRDESVAKQQQQQP
jgi:hypothetical protein